MMTWDSVFSTKQVLPRVINTYASRNAAILVEVARRRRAEDEGSHTQMLSLKSHRKLQWRKAGTRYIIQKDNSRISSIERRLHVAF